MSSILEEVLVDVAIRHVLPMLVERAASGAAQRAIRQELSSMSTGTSSRGGETALRALPSVEKVTVASSTPGRIRLHVAGLQGNRTREATVTAALRRLPGIQTVRANLVTGNVLVHYDTEQVGAADIVAAAGTVGSFSRVHSIRPQGDERPVALSVVR